MCVCVCVCMRVWESVCVCVCLCVCVCTSAGSPIHQLQPIWAGAAVRADAVGALTSQAQAVVLTFVHICMDTHTHTHTHTQRRHRHDTFTPAVNHWLSLQVCPSVVIWMRRFQTAGSMSEKACIISISGWWLILATVRSYSWLWKRFHRYHKLERAQWTTHLHTRGRWVPPWSPGRRPRRRRSPLCWCKHPWDTHLGSGTRQCLRNRRRRKG